MIVLHKLLLLAELAGCVAAQTTVTVNAKSTLQTIDGFGFSQAFGRATEFQNANLVAQKQGLDLLFSTTIGAGFSIIRNRIGSGGTGDSIEPTNPGSPSAAPKYNWDGKDSGQVWFSKQAIGYGVKTIYADAWSAPGFMKTSGNEATAGYLCGTTGHTCSSGDWRQAFASFLVQYVKYYAQEGITVTHLGFLNEPDFSPSYSQMQISSNAQEAISFIQTLHSTVQNAGLTAKLTCCDAIGWSSQAKYTAALKAAGMESYLGVITSHTYTSEATTPIDTKLPTWITESGTGSSSAFITTWYASGAAGEGFTWAAKIASAIVGANASAYLYWEGFEVGQTQSGSHLVDAAGSTATPSGILWAFAMWSRFVRPGAVRLPAAGSPAGVVTGAFRNADGSVVVVFTNTGGSAQSVKAAFDGFSPKSASAYLMDSSHTVAATSAPLSGGAVSVSIPSKGVVTVKLL